MEHEYRCTALDTSTHEVTGDDRRVPDVQPEQVGRTKHNTENSFGSVTSVVIMADGSTR